MSVSVVIPCHNQGRFLGEAIASAAAQENLVSEIVVVDDGSTDETPAVATRHGSVTYLHQERKGLSEARNSGWRASSGDYVVFLDADDRLLPGAVEAGLEAIGRCPHAAFAFGHYELIDELGAVLPTWRELRVADDQTFTAGDFELVLPDGRRGGRSPQPHRVSDHYTAMLRRNYISMHAAVVYRRAVLEETGGFDPRLGAL
jgi:glycosyltransferase involved in cell wall biosynthesis